MRRERFEAEQQRVQQKQAWDTLTYMDNLADDEQFAFNASEEQKQEVYSARNGAAAILDLPPRETYTTPQDILGKAMRDLSLRVSKGEIPASATASYLDGTLGPRWRDHYHDMRVQAQTAAGMAPPPEGI